MARQSHAQSTAGGHAIVIGASMSGLLAARVLAEHFDRVTIVERDRLPQGPEPRRGVPQAGHFHQLMLQGKLLLEQLFPGLSTELAAAGAPSIEWPADVLWLSPVGWGPRFRSGLTTSSCSRALLDWIVYRRLAALDRISFLEERDVIALLPDERMAGVSGVRVRRRGSPSATPGGEEELRADLVVDASGRSSQMPRWLAALGCAPPRETTINAFLGYASRCYGPPAGHRADWKGLLLQSRPPVMARGGALFPIEQGVWIVTLVGAARDYPPTDEAGFLEFARSLTSPLLYEAIKDARPISPIYGYRRTANHLRHYDRLSRWPERLVVLGDAVCAFNPVYGQGMTASALAARVLDGCLRAQRRRHPDGDLAGLSRHFQRRLAKSNAAPWLIATGEDFRYPTTEGGQRTWLTRVLHWYMDRVMLLAATRHTISLAFLETIHLLKPPAALFQPSIMAPVLMHVARQRVSGTIRYLLHL